MCVNNCSECNGECATNLCEVIVNCEGLTNIDTKETATETGLYEIEIKFIETVFIIKENYTIGSNIEFQFMPNENYCYNAKVKSPSGVIKKYKFCTKKGYQI
jgi:hypothetical protein